MDKRVSRVLKNEYIFAVCSKFVNIAVALLQSILIARYFGPELKGIQSYIHSITSIGSIVVTFGIHQAYPYFRKKYGKENILQDYLSISYILYAVYFVIAGVLAFAVFDSIELKVATMLIPLLGYTRVVSYVNLVESPNKRNVMFLATEIVNVVFLAVLLVSSGIGLAWAQRSMGWLIVSMLLLDALRAIVYTISLRIRPHFSKSMKKLALELAKFGFFPMIALLMTTLNYRIDILMLRESKYITDAQVGIYSVGVTLAEKIVLIPDSLKGVLVSKLTKGAGDKEVVKALRLSFLASIAVCIAFLLLGQWGITLLYGKEYSGAYSVMMICAVGALSIGFFKLIAQYNIVNKMQLRNVIMLSIAILIDVVFNLLLIPRYGLEGAAVATCLGNFVCGVVFVLYFAKRVKVNPLTMVIPQKEDFSMVRKLFKRAK